MPLKNTVKLSPHQERAIDKTVDNDGQILLTWEMGTGKTLGSVAIMEKLKEKKKGKVALAVVPSALRYNYAENGVKKFTNEGVTIFGTKAEDHANIDDLGIPKTPYYVVSYDMFKKDPHRYLDKTGADTLIVDEMHNFRNPDTQNFKQMRSVRGRVKNFIGLTGTPLNNDPYDIVPLIDIVSNGRHKLGRNKQAFSRTYMREFMDRHGDKHKVIINREQLKSELTRYVHHATQDDLAKGEMAPKKLVDYVDVEMSPLQIQQYKYVMDQLPSYISEKIKKGLPVDRKEATWILPKLMQARNVMNGVHYLNKNISLSESAMRTPKIRKALDDIENHIQTTPDAQVLVHSHMLEGGVDVMAQGLKDRGIPAGVYTGRQTADEREQLVKAYNARKLRALVISSAGATGLNLPDTTMHVALDGHFNPAVIDQIEARGVRAGGQQHRPEEARAVIVRRYRSVFPHTWITKWGLAPRDTSVDEWVYSLAANKNDMNNQVQSMLQKAAAAAIAYHYSRKGKEPGNILDLAAKNREKVVDQLSADGRDRGDAEAYLSKRQKLERLLISAAKKLLGDKVDLKHPLYFRIGRDKNNWGGEKYEEYKIDPALLAKATFSPGDSFDYFRKHFGDDKRLKDLITEGQMTFQKIKGMLDKDKKPEMLDRKGGNYIEGQLWADYEVKGDKIVPAEPTK